jgi:MoaA/NifB/PqqE/SkfB family radical SAM enzyme
MPLDRFSNYMSRMEVIVKNASEFMFSSVEPLLHPQLFEMMDIVSKINPGMSFPIQTNGMFLTESIIESMKSRNIPWASVALDGYNQSSVEYFKVGSDFNLIISNIEKLRLGMPEDFVIRTVFVSHQGNIKKLPEYVRFCKKIGVDAVDINGLLCFNKELVSDTLYSYDGNEEAEKIFAEAKEIAKSEGIQFQYPELIPKIMGCEWKKIFSVDEDGNVAPCVMLSKQHPFYFLNSYTAGSQVLFGNIFEREPIEIWMDADYVEFRKRLDSIHMPKQCLLCAEGHGVVCSNR